MLAAAADLDSTPLQSNSIDMDLAAGGYLSLMNKPRHRVLEYVVDPALFSCPSYAILNGRATKLLSLTVPQLRAGGLARGTLLNNFCNSTDGHVINA
jgi:hypothetical protein